MATIGGSNIVMNGLILNLDAGNRRSYPGSGTSWVDLSPSRVNGTLTNGPTFSSANAGGIVFDGVNDSVSLANPSFTNQLTIEVWVNLNSTTPSGTGWILGRESSYRLIYSSTAFSWICSTTNNGWYTAGTFVGASVGITSGFYHVVGTYNGANIVIYVNGVLQQTGSAISGNVSGGSNYELMRTGAGNVDWGKGTIYSHRIYNRALSASEILQNYNALKGRFNL